jgi:hypothetical protein
MSRIDVSWKFYVAMAKSFRENIKDYNDRNHAVVSYCETIMELGLQYTTNFDMIKFRIASGVSYEIIVHR